MPLYIVPDTEGVVNVEDSFMFVTVIVIDEALDTLLYRSIAVTEILNTLFAPESKGASKSGEIENRIPAVFESTATIENLKLSTPPEIEIVADSETVIKAALDVVAIFSATEKDAEFEKVGAIKSILKRTMTIPDPPAPPFALAVLPTDTDPPPPPPPVLDVPALPPAPVVESDLAWQVPAAPPPPAPPCAGDEAHVPPPLADPVCVPAPPPPE
jgi:hypothetical protein